MAALQDTLLVCVGMCPYVFVGTRVHARVCARALGSITERLFAARGDVDENHTVSTTAKRDRESGDA